MKAEVLKLVLKKTESLNTRVQSLELEAQRSDVRGRSANHEA